MSAKCWTSLNGHVHNISKFICIKSYFDGGKCEVIFDWSSLESLEEVRAGLIERDFKTIFCRKNAALHRIKINFKHYLKTSSLG